MNAEIAVLEPWEPIEYLCYPDGGSKAYKHPSGANIHIINMYDGGEYIAQKEIPGEEFIEHRFLDYDEAVRIINKWMRYYE